MSKQFKGLGDYKMEQREAVPSARQQAGVPIPVQVIPGKAPPEMAEKFSWILDLPYGNVFVRPYPGITPALAVRIDMPVSGRVMVYIQNIGNNGLWLGFGKSGLGIAVNMGVFLPGSPVPGAHLGGIQAWPLKDTVEIWGRADVPGNTDIIIVECAP